MASSRRCGNWDVRFAVDGDVTTSWASGPAPAEGSTVLWTGVRDDIIGSIELVSNAAHYQESFRTGYGFEFVHIAVLDEGGTPVWEVLVDLPGTPDPDVVVNPFTVGRSVRLTLSGHEDPSTGGFAELIVLAVR